VTAGNLMVRYASRIARLYHETEQFQTLVAVRDCILASLGMKGAPLNSPGFYPSAAKYRCWKAGTRFASAVERRIASLGAL
jgi:hypothetical protein